MAMKKNAFVLLIIGCAPFLFGSSEQQIVDFESERWNIDDPDAEVMFYMNEKSLYLVEGVAHLKDVDFENGVIEVDVAAHGNAGFAGVVFRYQPGGDHEEIYIRPHKSGPPDVLQHTPVVHGSAAWQLYSGPGYTAEAYVPTNRWVHLKIVVSGEKAEVFLNGAPEPDLIVTDLKNGISKGSIGLWGRFGAANFANFRYALAPSHGASARVPSQNAPPGVIRDWSLSEAFLASEFAEDTLPANGMTWSNVQSEPDGLVNISRFRTKTTTTRADVTANQKNVAFAKAVIHSDRNQVKRMSFGYSDEVSIFLNGQILFSADSTFRSRDPGFLGIVGVDNDAVYLSLEKGDNELMLAVRETFGGWGFICRLDDMTGVTLQ